MEAGTMTGYATDISYPPVAICRLNHQLSAAELEALPETVRGSISKRGFYEQQDIESYLVASKVTRHVFRDDDGKVIWRMDFGRARPLEVDASHSVAFELVLRA
jgi:hypothetical protein